MPGASCRPLKSFATWWSSPPATARWCCWALFGVLALFGYSINTLTMFAMVLAIGLLVD
ncbi:efflux RND transporter permease subunit, partial [Pseudomonas sp. MAFF 301451]|nr:efflux RND transporter permease subunit [Pseudomonas cyclaminis]